MADLSANFLARTRHVKMVTVFYEKTGKPREDRKTTIQEFLNAETTFTSTLDDLDDTNIAVVWIGKTKLIHGVEMHFSAILSEDVGYDDVNTSRLTLNVSSDPKITLPPFSYILM